MNNKQLKKYIVDTATKQLKIAVARSQHSGMAACAESGKHKIVMINAIKNKLISRMFAVVERKTLFVPLLKHV